MHLLKKQTNIGTILLQWFLIGSVLLMHTVHGKFTEDEINRILKAEIDRVKEKAIVVNPNGPLSPQKLCAYKEKGYIHNKRFFAPEINTYFSLIDNRSGICYIRDPTKDKVYTKGKDGKKVSKYIIEYHKKLIEMFPSPKQKISIFPAEGCTDSFTLFLNSPPVKKHAYMILASLLLQAEGINVPLSLNGANGNGQSLVLSTAGRNTVVFSLKMNISFSFTLGSGSSKSEETKDVYQESAASIIRFFKNCIDDSRMQKGGVCEESTLADEFQNGLFMNRALFLISSYIFEYINDEKGMSSFIQRVYELACNQYHSVKKLKDSIKAEKIEAFLDRYFVFKENHLNSEYSLQKEKKSSNLMIEIQDNNEVPLIMILFLKSNYIIEKGSRNNTVFGKLSNTPIWSEHFYKNLPGLNVENKKSRVKNIIDNILVDKNKIDPEVLRKWNKMIETLDSSNNIKENRNGFKIPYCIIDALRFISYATGHQIQYRLAISDIENIMKNNGKPNEAIKTLQKTITDLFTVIGTGNIQDSLTLKKPPKDNTLEVELINTEVFWDGSNIKVFGEVKVFYPYNDEKEGISIEVYRGVPLKVSLISPIKKVIGAVQSDSLEYNSEGAPPQNDIIGERKQAMQTRELSFAQNSHEYLAITDKDLIRMEKTGFKYLNRLFLHGIIDGKDCKAKLVSLLVGYMHDVEKERVPGDAVTRFLHNILGSERFEDPDMQKILSTSIAYKMVSDFNCSDMLVYKDEYKNSLFTFILNEKVLMLRYLIYNGTCSDILNWMVLYVQMRRPASRRRLDIIFKKLPSEDIVWLVKRLSSDGRVKTSIISLICILKRGDNKLTDISILNHHNSNFISILIGAACQKENLMPLVPSMLLELDLENEFIGYAEMHTSKYYENAICKLESIKYMRKDERFVNNQSKLIKNYKESLAMCIESEKNHIYKRADAMYTKVMEKWKKLWVYECTE
ncbi:hypothetical protein NEAUS03_1614 [Nematocida ausubeli]|nr:hypothetical protein NEAUS03_1614 [Nematocida ausubeli]